MQSATNKANAQQEMYSLVMVSQCVAYQRASFDDVSKGGLSLWNCIACSKWKNESVEYYVQDQCQGCEHQQTGDLSKL